MKRSDWNELKYELEKESRVCDEALKGMASVLPFSRYSFSNRDELCILHERAKSCLTELSNAVRRSLYDVIEQSNLVNHEEAHPVSKEVYDALKQMEKAFPAGEYSGLNAEQHLALNRLLELSSEVRKA